MGISYLRKLGAPEHLYRAWRKISKKKRSQGFDRQTIERFRRDLDRNIAVISQELRSGSFQFTPFLGCFHQKPGGGKRPIKIPAVRDRVVLKAIQLLIAHKFRRYDLACSFGYVRDRRVSDAVDHVRELANAGNVWVLEADISAFFDTVDRDLLMQRFVREIGIRSLNDLVTRALQVEVGNLDSFSPTDKELFPLADSGIPQGGVLSPLLANFYLFPFDRAMTNAGFNLVRYADDFVVMCRSREEAHAAYTLAINVLQDELHLKLHPLDEEKSKTRITLYSKGFTFLGLHFQGGRVEPSGKAAARFRDKVTTLTDSRLSCGLLQTLTALKHTIDGWAHAYLAYDSAETFRDLDVHVRQELSRFLVAHRFIAPGQTVSCKQRRILGLPSLEGIRARGGSTGGGQRHQPTARKGAGEALDPPFRGTVGMATTLGARSSAG